MEIEREGAAAGDLAGAGRPRGRRAVLAAGGAAALTGLTVGAERLPGWGLDWGGLRAEFGGRREGREGAAVRGVATPEALSRLAFASHTAAAGA